jgi:hypothetical protein
MMKLKTLTASLLVSIALTGGALAQVIDISKTGATQSATNSGAVTNSGSITSIANSYVSNSGVGSTVAVSATGAANSASVTMNTFGVGYEAGLASAPSAITLGVAQTSTNLATGSVSVTAGSLGNIVLGANTGTGAVAAVAATGAANSVSVTVNRN